MNDDHAPVFRKRFVPWYDSDRLCAILAAFMLLVAAFGACGVSVALEAAEWTGYVWLPAILTLLAAGVAASTLRRLLQRLWHRASRQMP
jgi:hypothetical protein